MPSRFCCEFCSTPVSLAFVCCARSFGSAAVFRCLVWHRLKEIVSENGPLSWWEAGRFHGCGVMTIGWTMGGDGSDAIGSLAQARAIDWALLWALTFYVSLPPLEKTHLFLMGVDVVLTYRGADQ